MTSGKTVIAFDLYGTLLSTESIATELAQHFGDEKAKTVSASWRRYQLEYTWRLNSMGLYRPFDEVTRASLEHALAEQGLSLSPGDADRLMRAYDALDVFPEVPAALGALAGAAAAAYVFSNGTDQMVGRSVAASPGLGPHRGLFGGLVTVEEGRAFKPDAAVYGDLVGRVGAAGGGGGGGGVWLVSANPFDVVGAEAAGLRAAWIDRAGTGWVDKLGDIIGGLKPTIVAAGVDEAVEEILRLGSS